ncbi:MAG TPA: NUDIX hydrolase [Chloroflexota bacterium]|nr:NUDIX hydrolase [Chloroflexota bacterium]
MERSYPVRPWIAVGVVVVRDGRVLLVQRGKEPGKGLWAVPGGMVDLGETVRGAARREAKEETGLDVEVGEVFWVVDSIGRDADGRVSWHNVIVDFLAVSPEGEAECADDAMDVRWCGPEDLGDLALTPTMWPLLEKLFDRDFSQLHQGLTE